MVFSSFKAQITHTVLSSMGQRSLPVLQHGLLWGLVAVQNGNCCWKAVQRNWVALGEWACVDPKI